MPIRMTARVIPSLLSKLVLSDVIRSIRSIIPPSSPVFRLLLSPSGVPAFPNGAPWKQLKAAQSDPNTLAMIAKLKTDEGRRLETLSKETSPMEVVQTLKASLDEMKAIETLFADPVRAVEELEKEGLLGEKKKNLKYYKENPQALEIEMQRGLYFGFVTVAVAGGLIE